MVKENKEVQVLRGIAILAVVGIHTFSLGKTNTMAGTIGNWFFQIIHVLLQFAVPTFVFISAMMITYTLGEKRLAPINFYKKKLLKVGVPFVIWTLVYVLAQMVGGLMPFDRLFSLNSWGYWLLYGKGYTHLYYLSVTMQLYLIAPLLVWGIRLINKWLKKLDFGVLLVIAIIGQICIYFLNKFYIYQYFTATATMVIWYFCIIVLGMWAGLNYERFIAGLKKCWIPLLIGLVVVGGFYIDYNVKIINNVKINTSYYQLTWYLYVILMALSLLLLSIWLRESKLGKGLGILGKYSFGIYLMHPLMTYWLRKWVTISKLSLLGIIIIVSMAVMIAICILVIKILIKNKWTSIILGNYQGFKPKQKVEEPTDDKVVGEV